MKVIISGSRRLPSLGLNYYNDWKKVNQEHQIYKILVKCILASKFNITEVVSGTCWGIDKLGEMWAINNGIPTIVKPADWNKLGKRAGYVRNEEMAKIGEALICICTEDSKGSTHMVKIMNELNKPVYHKII